MSTKEVKTKERWTFKAHSYQIADTGDYDGHYEVTNGADTMIIREDDEDYVIELVELLNAGGRIHFDDAKEIDLVIDNGSLKEQLRIALEGQKGPVWVKASIPNLKGVTRFRWPGADQWDQQITDDFNRSHLYGKEVQCLDESTSSLAKPGDDWISVEDRLPEEIPNYDEAGKLVSTLVGYHVLVYDPGDEAIVYDCFWSAIRGFEGNKDITHWRPLPAPPGKQSTPRTPGDGEKEALIQAQDEYIKFLEDYEKSLSGLYISHPWMAPSKELCDKGVALRAKITATKSSLETNKKEI